MTLRLPVSLLFLALAGFMAFGAYPCELERPVMFAGLDWDSSRVQVAVARHIVEHGYGCRTDSLPVATLPAVAGVVRGDLDVIMEVWKDNIPEAWAKGLAAGKVVELGVSLGDARQAWFVPRYLVEGDAERGIEPAAPGLRSVADLPRYKELFRDPEEPGKGRFYNCVAGWDCEVVNSKKLAAYGLEEHFTNFRAGSGEALAAVIASAYRRGRPVLAYYWSPTWVLGVYDLLPLAEPPYDPEVWQELRGSDRPRRATEYPPSRVVIGVNRRFHDAAPELVELLTRWQTSSAIVSGMLVKMKEGRVTEEEAAREFLKEQPEVWGKWVPAEVAARVQASLR